MIGLSWNVRGLGNPRAFAALGRLLKKHSPDIVFLSEMKTKESRANNIKMLLGFSGGFHVDCVRKSGGLILPWKDSVEVMILSCSSGHIDARVKLDDGFNWHFSGFYGDPVASKRKDSWTLLRRLRRIDDILWLCGNDFNELLSQSEKVGGSDKSFTGMFQFCQAVEDYDLVDLWFSGPRLTWNNKRDGRLNIQERLDRFLADNQWRDRFLDIRVDHLGFNTSDHRPILLLCSTVTQVHQGPIRAFRFEPFWLKDADFGKVIDADWKETGPSLSVLALRMKLELCATTLGAWSRRKFGNIRRQIETKNREIDRLYKCCGKPGVLTNISQLERAIEGLLECEKIYWMQRSRADWL
ncbi:hypothetical protein Dsin_016477 [Dipteronia sinensis]|uniref:Endonuclease/exonuclease/phosphatase domain-containing protein n=1 Tax=Dipteronia sinensis TaxID=43782 RepID=A0AAE0ADU2_9ROSI|nr:hypothetical protein Dsin_016477 [Dipteronia sinensis]